MFSNFKFPNIEPDQYPGSLSSFYGFLVIEMESRGGLVLLDE